MAAVRAGPVRWGAWASFSLAELSVGAPGCGAPAGAAPGPPDTPDSLAGSVEGEAAAASEGPRFSRPLPLESKAVPGLLGAPVGLGAWPAWTPLPGVWLTRGWTPSVAAPIAGPSVAGCTGAASGTKPSPLGCSGGEGGAPWGSSLAPASLAAVSAELQAGPGEAPWSGGGGGPGAGCAGQGLRGLGGA